MKEIIGYQIQNQHNENFEHTSFEVIQDSEQAESLRKQAESKFPNDEWLSMVIQEGDIENYSLI